MSRCATGQGVTSPSTSTRPTPHSSGGSSYRLANVTRSLLRDARDLVRRPLAQELVVVDELDVGLDTDRPMYGFGEPCAEITAGASAGGGVADAQSEPVDLAAGPGPLGPARARLPGRLAPPPPDAPH